ncbi:molybdopterin-dependent oxidoreductase, partial [Roseateles sp.]|uniref:molybdopterin-dependent oxidoreductase n=1 Tax=Roseateles sp. TaxID=1971397 RepID=UPI00286D337D
FGQELAGVMELGMQNRGEHSEITTFVGQTIDSELSGNMIDICPVGALTSKPFRYAARTWELSRRKSISPHDSTGANLVVQVKGNQVMRVVPLENEAVNECWISDRDRFSYEALNSDQRLTQPMIKQGGAWKTVDWSTALEYVANGLKLVRAEHGAAAIGALGSAHSTVEELHLLAKLVRGLGSQNVDYRQRHADFSNTAASGQAHWLGLPIAALSSLDRALVVGSFLRKDHPLFALRLRQAARHGAQIMSIHASEDDWLMPVAARITVAPSSWVQALADVAAAVAAVNGVAAPAAGTATEAAQAIADGLLSGQHKAILLGNAAAEHPQAASLLSLANWISAQTGASVGYLTAAANTVGAQLVNALPQQGGLNAGQMLSDAGLKGLLLLNTDPVLDSANAAAAAKALAAAEMVVVMSPFKTGLDYADVLLPTAPFTETSGTFVSAEGRAQSFVGVVKALGETRPGWKILRVLGNLLALDGFAQDSSEQVRSEALGVDLSAQLSNAGAAAIQAGTSKAIERLADLPIYAADALVRHATSLQLSNDARQAAVATLPTALWQQLGLSEGGSVRITQDGSGAVQLPAKLDTKLPANVLRVPSGLPETAALGAIFGGLNVSKV